MTREQGPVDRRRALPPTRTGSRADDRTVGERGRRPGATEAVGPLVAGGASAGAGDVATIALDGLTTLQRHVGNEALRRALDGGRSPVLDVVGRGGGTPLAPDVREDMEARLGADFSDVRVHTDGTAASSAVAVGAHAYTVGRDVVFGDGKFDTTSMAGRTMLAHELTHVVQQRGGPVSGTDTGNGVAVSDPGDRFEREAEANATRVMRVSLPREPDQEPPGDRVVQRAAGQGLVVQRQGHRPATDAQIRFEGQHWTVVSSSENNPQITVRSVQGNRTRHLAWATAAFTILRPNNANDHDMRQRDPGAHAPVDPYSDDAATRAQQIRVRYDAARDRALTMIKAIVRPQVNKQSRAGLDGVPLDGFVVVRSGPAPDGVGREPAEWRLRWVEGDPDRPRRVWYFTIDVDDPLPQSTQEPHVGWTVTATEGTQPAVANVFGHVWLDFVPTARE